MLKLKGFRAVPHVPAASLSSPAEHLGQRISNFKPGVYAVSVTGRLPQGIVRELKSRGVAYKSRDTAIKT